MSDAFRGGTRNFPTGPGSSDEGAKIWSDWGLACSDWGL